MAVSITEFLGMRNQRPVVDVRSEGEFTSGHIPGAINLPVLNNEERKAVGTCYIQKGQAAAIMEGFRRVGPRLADIVSAALGIAHKSEILVHCWRGGMRSGNFCQFVSMAGVQAESLTGGYKEYRRYVLDTFRKDMKLVLLTGFTGSGKSEVLRALRDKGEQIIDLEFLARHKGSAFGGLQMPPQPTTEQFQNELFEEILKLDLSATIWVEDESLAIGKIFLPADFWNRMNASPLVEIAVEKPTRVERLVTEYGGADRGEFLVTMNKIAKRLGNQHFKTASEKLLAGEMHEVIMILLTYYDKAYQESIEKRKEKIIGTLTWDGHDVTQLTDELILYSGQER